MPASLPADIRKKHETVINRCSLFAGLSAAEVDAVLALTEYEEFKSGEAILTEGKRFHGVWVLLSGTCEVVKQGPKLDSRLATLEPANIFGEMSFLHPSPHSASVRALESVGTMRLMLQSFEKLREECPKAAHKLVVNIVRVLSDRLRRMDEWTCELVEKSSDNRQHKEWHEFRSKLYTNLFE